MSTTAPEAPARARTTIDPAEGVTAYIYRWNLGECSNGGISARVQQVTVVGAIYRDGTGRRVNQPGPFRVTDDAPAVVLVHREVRGISTGQRRTIVHAQPYDPDRLTGWMSGGTFIAGDSRVSDLAGDGIGGFHGAISLHDRRED